MPSESSPICFRVPADERALLEVVARYLGETLSSFVRNTVTLEAQRIIEVDGVDAVFGKFETLEAQRAQEVSAKMDAARRAKNFFRRGQD